MTQITTRDGRYYEWGGEKYPSVTTILSKGIAKPGLIRWAGKLVAETAVKQFDEWYEKDEQEAIDWLASAPDRRRNSSANLGSAIHAAIDAVANDRPISENISPEAMEYVNGFMSFVRDWRPKFVLTEAAVFSRTQRYAGTLDIVARIGRSLWVIDTKTGNRVYPETALQLAAYANAEFVGREGGTEEPFQPVKKGGILHLAPNTYTLVPARIDGDVFDTFLAVRDMWRWDSELSKIVLREPVEKK